MSDKQIECYWDKSIDMSKATLQVDGKVICKFDNDNQTIIVNDGFKTPREIKLEARVKELEEEVYKYKMCFEQEKDNCKNTLRLLSQRQKHCKRWRK